jgi:hypothetical protein
MEVGCRRTRLVVLLLGLYALLAMATGVMSQGYSCVPFRVCVSLIFILAEFNPFALLQGSPATAHKCDVFLEGHNVLLTTVQPPPKSARRNAK